MPTRRVPASSRSSVKRPARRAAAPVEELHVHYLGGGQLAGLLTAPGCGLSHRRRLLTNRLQVVADDSRRIAQFEQAAVADPGGHIAVLSNGGQIVRDDDQRAAP